MNLVENLKLPIMVFVGLILAIYPIVSQADSSAVKPTLAHTGKERWYPTHFK
jgi:hypothetical protein